MSFIESISGYSFSLIGRSHKKKGTVCQDASVVAKIGRLCLLAVADGVGSAPQSEKGSALAIKSVLDLCTAEIKGEEDSFALADILKQSFNKALDEIEALAKAEGNKVGDYTTTLTACLYDGERVVVGHVGDGGVIAVDSEGYHHSLTKVQKGEAHNEVYPLPVREKWVFEVMSGSFDAVILLTDGLLDAAMPPIMAKKEENIYRRFVTMFLPYKNLPQAEVKHEQVDKAPIVYSNKEIDSTKKATEAEKLQETKSKEVEPTSKDQMQDAPLFSNEVGENDMLSAVVKTISLERYSYVTDDISAAVAYRTDKELKIPSESYFKEPDWDKMKEDLFKKLYPSLLVKEEKANAAEKP